MEFRDRYIRFLDKEADKLETGKPESTGSTVMFLVLILILWKLSAVLPFEPEAKEDLRNILIELHSKHVLYLKRSFKKMKLPMFSQMCVSYSGQLLTPEDGKTLTGFWSNIKKLFDTRFSRLY